MLCILKSSDMVKQVKRAMLENEMVKITIENFQKRDGILFTSEKSSIEIDTEVFILIKNYRYIYLSKTEITGQKIRNISINIYTNILNKIFGCNIQEVPEVTKPFKQEDMFADITDIDSLSGLPPAKKVSICGYVRKV